MTLCYFPPFSCFWRRPISADGDGTRLRSRHGEPAARISCHQGYAPRKNAVCNAVKILRCLLIQAQKLLDFGNLKCKLCESPLDQSETNIRDSQCECL